MDVQIILSKPIFTNSSLFTSMISTGTNFIYLSETIIMKLFNVSKVLRYKYNSLSNFCDNISMIDSTFNTEFISAITKDCCLIVFDIINSTTGIITLPILEGIMICDLLTYNGEILIIGLHQILIFNWKTRILSGIDFYAPFNIKNLPEDRKSVV